MYVVGVSTTLSSAKLVAKEAQFCWQIVSELAQICSVERTAALKMAQWFPFSFGVDNPKILPFHGFSEA